MNILIKPLLDNYLYMVYTLIVFMSIKDQLHKLKENWLLIVLVLILFVSLSNIGTPFLGGIETLSSGLMRSAMTAEYEGAGYYPTSTDFAPEVEERVIIKDAYVSTEVKKGAFQESESKLKSIITSSDAYLLNENVNKYETGRKSYYQGTYSIKVTTTKYDSVVEQLKSIGEVQSFRENARDVTGTYTNLEAEIEAEKARLARYNEMYSEATEISDKIELNDRIFNQERRIKYLEDSLKNIDQKVDYSQISLTLTEKRSEYANVIFIKFSELVKSLVNSFNSLLSLVFYVIPWAIALLIIRWIVKLFKKK